MGDGRAVRDAAGAAEVMADRIEALVRTGPGPVIVALDGRSGAGKSTLAAAVGAHTGGPSDVVILDGAYSAREPGRPGPNASSASTSANVRANVWASPGQRAETNTPSRTTQAGRESVGVSRDRPFVLRL